MRTGTRAKPRPQVGLCILLLAAAFPVLFAIGGGKSASVFDLAVGLCGVQLMLMFGAAKLPVPPKRMTAVVGSLLALTFVSLIWTTSTLDTAFATVSWAESLVVLIFATVVLRDQTPETVMRWIARFGLLLLVAPVLMYLHVQGFAPPVDELGGATSGTSLSYYTRFSHPFIGRSNNLATMLAMLFIPLAWWAARRRRHRVAALLVGVAMLLTLSRGVLLPVSVCGVLVVLRSREQAARILRWVAMPLIVGGLVAVAVVAYDPLVASQIGTRLSGANITARSGLLQGAQQVISLHPVIGVGGGTGTDIHNTYLQQVVYFGIPLGTFAVWMLARVPLWFFHRSEAGRVAGLGVLAAWVSFLGESSMEGALLRPLIFVCVGLLAAFTLAAERASGDLVEHAAEDRGQVHRGRERRRECAGHGDRREAGGLDRGAGRR